MNIKLELLKLHFQKNLQYKNTLIIITFTYFIATLIPFLIGQLSFKNAKDTFTIGIISLTFIIVSLQLFNNLNHHLKQILIEIKKLTK